MMNQKVGVELASVEEHNQLQQHEINIPDSPHINARKLTTNGTDQLHSTDHLRHPLLNHQQDIKIPVHTRRLSPNLPCRDLLTGPREIYNKIGVSLYKASIKGDWKAARFILCERPELVRYSITENSETALHVAASAKRSKHVEKFVRNLVDLMRNEDLALQNENHNTALYLAAAAGNIKTLKIMVERNRDLLTIPGAGGQMMPLYVAALHGNYEVVKYMFEHSRGLSDDGWTAQNCGWFLQKCVEADMFEIALQTVKDRPEFAGSGNILGLLARKPDAFSETRSNIIWRKINYVFSVIGLKVGPPEKDCEALQLLRIVWENIAKKPKTEIDKTLRGPVDSIKQDDTPASGKVVQALQLRKLISEQHDKMHVETQNIIRGPSNLINQDTESVSGKVSQALQLQELIYEHLVNIHVETQNIIRGSPDLVKQDTVLAFGKVDQAQQLQKLISKHIVNMHAETKTIIKWPPASEAEDKAQALRLQKTILNHIDKMHEKTQNIIRGREIETHSSRILFVAAEMGNTEFVIELIRQYPDLIWKINDNSVSIFHVAVKHRREGIYNLLYEIGSMKDLVTPLRDEDGNNMLHLAGKITKKKRLEDVSGAALQMQRELLWFKMMRQAGHVQLTSTNEQYPISQQQQQQQETMSTPIDSDDVNYSRRLPNLPPLDLLTGPRKDYRKFCIPLYEASIKCDWKAAKAILDQKSNLLRHSITENRETALHVAASAKVPQKMGEVFVKNLVDLMDREDLALENENFNTALYLAAAAGNLETVRIMVEKNRDLVAIPGAGRQMLPLYAAALFKKDNVVKYLFGKSNDLCDDDGWNDTNRALLLEKCVENDKFDMALQIVKKYPKLGRHGSVLGILAQKTDAFAEKPNIIRSVINWMGIHINEFSIIEMVLEYIDSYFKMEIRDGQALQLLRFILDDILELTKNEIDNILIRGPNAIKQAKRLVSSKGDRVLELQKLISEHIVNMHVETQNILQQDSKSTFVKGDQVVQLEKVISEHITKMQVKTQNIIRGPVAKDTHSSEALFTAAEMGNTMFIVELIRRYPDIMWKVNDNNQTIFHIAVENRHKGIYTMLYEIGYMKDSITSLHDENGNNMLHLVAKIAKKKKLEEMPGVMFQMQRELLWFKEVESMINPSCIEQRNKDGLTPHELFTKEHEDLLAQSVKWVKGTANQCMIVAALVATIAFAAAITVPGGYDQNNGMPIFYRDTAYTVFIFFDGASLFTSSTSTILFITILTSQFGEHDFLGSIPKKFTLFLYMLFASIQLMILSFSVSFFLIYRKGRTWIPIIGCVSAILVYLYLALKCSNMFLHIVGSTFGSGCLYKPKKYVLYYQNPVH